MRRVSLALALAGAVAAAGCGKSSSAGNSGNRGVAQGTFNITVQNGQNGNKSLAITGGYVVSTPAGIDCGIAPHNTCSADFADKNPDGTPLVVTLTATPVAPNVFWGFAGDCWAATPAADGTGSCTLQGLADKYILAQFATSTGHPNWTDPAFHAPNYISDAFNCQRCHGATLSGQGLAPSCGRCHEWPMTSIPLNLPAPFVGKHFDPAQAPWGTHSGSNWDQACQRCHTDQGFRDYIGQLAAPGEANPSDNHLDGTFLSTNTLKTDTATTAYSHGPLQCGTCHNSVSDPLGTGMSGLLFPSGAQVNPDKVTTLCGQCHEARESTVSMNTLIGTAAVDAQLNTAAGVSFKNPHYRGAAATLYGSVAQGWAQYPGQVYTGQNKHGGAARCTVCHDPHTGDVDSNVKTTTCGACHFKADGTPVASMADLEANRQYGFNGDIDGDGTEEPLDVEINSLKATLNTAIQAYANDITGQGVCFDDNTYPYFLKHTGRTGACTQAELTAAAAFKAFTPRLMRAAYNLKFATTEYGAWAHNPRYAIEVLFDAITDLNTGLAANGKTVVPFTGYRTFQGHFGASESKHSGGDQFADWNTSGFTGTNVVCSQCHGGEVGLANYVATGPAITATPATPVTGMQCTTCHTVDGATMDSGFRAITNLYFPPAKTDPTQFATFAATIFPQPQDRVCATCHTGRENKTTVDLAIAAATTTFGVGFKNPHYLGAAGMMLGSNAHMLYEYPGQPYASYPVFYGEGSTNGAAPGPYGSPHGGGCTGCHNPQGTRHSFQIDLSSTVPDGLYNGVPNTLACDGCHTNSTHGDHRLEPYEANVQALAAELLVKINAYQVRNSQNPVCYAGGAYPYWYVGSVNPGGQCGATETTGYGSKWDAKTAKAIFNYQWSQKEPGAFAHNYDYIAQALIDSIMDLDPAAVLPCDAHDAACVNGVGGTTVLTRP